MIGIQGIGWIDETCYGTFSAEEVRYTDRVALGKLGKEDELFAFSVKNFGRFAPLTQRVCYAASLALRDAGITYGKDLRFNMGVLGSNPGGCVESNRAYFSDYVAGGRTLSRANLFIYTLPSSPFAEVAVHFGLQGPLLYGASGGALTEMACGLIQRRECEQVLLLLADTHCAVGVVMGTCENTECPVDLLKDSACIGAALLQKIKNLRKARNKHES